ncbi:hypothetical protein [Actinomadura oligospora]|uniref:hypothetical protein n=1 Tax=Actinomadura oligospora TaxID=111804 RepID=UPI0012F8160F|nr:hypothetical protein [Actinomadura oligospora]
MSLTDLASGFRDEEQLTRVRAVIEWRLADDRRQQECRYLMRFWWQLSMPYREVSLEELRAHLGERKLAAVEALIAAIRTSPERIDAWADVVEPEFPVVHDRGHETARE